MFRTNDKETSIFELIFMIEYFIFKLGCSNSEKALKEKEKADLHSRSEDHVKPGNFP